MQLMSAVQYIPVRLFHDERKYLRLIRSTLKVSSYTDKVPVVPLAERRLCIEQWLQVDSVFADEAKHVRTKVSRSTV